ncbi:MAG TPA: 16S rRNA (uracil(1498)-N(3))-methyltransferase [Candidatus Baltobacteraceae bacterium]|nr:16S rRNA (uracil(1498)-N(3))-methyltransferase [Candidatus Baltobacteraceae bacterium]
MPARRFFVPDVHRLGELVAIDGSDAHKIAHVLRLRDGDEIEIVDSAGAVFAARLESRDENLAARLTERRASHAGSEVAIDVAQAIPKGAKMEFVVEKLSELGVRALLPFESERTVVRDPRDAKLERWRRVARSAAQQSGRSDVIAIEEPAAFTQVCERMDRYDLVLLPWELAEPQPLRGRLPELIAGARRILVVIGPEGGFSHAEAELAQAARARPIWLGPRILRTETAALAVAAILGYELLGR